MRRGKLEKKIRRYVELSKKFELKPEEVSNNESGCVNSGILSMSSGGFGITYTGTSVTDNVTSDQSEQELILRKIVDDFTASREVVNDWFEYLELQEELGGIR